MNRRLLAATLGFFMPMIFVGTAFVSASFASPSHAVAQNKPSGLTIRGIANAHASGTRARLVVMQSQSSVALLQKATEIGPHATDSNIEITIGLKLRNEAKLKSFLQQVQNAASPVYHQWLTPKEFTERYGPSKAQVTQVVQFLKSHRIKVRNVSSNRILIHTEATTAAYEQAFGIEINDYKLEGRSFYSTTDSPRLPREIAPLVTNILGLNHGVQMRLHSFFKPLGSAVARGASPHDVTAPPPSLTSFSPLQIAQAYDWPNITHATNGAGVTVAILTANSSWVAWNESPHIFWGAYGLPDHVVNVIPVDGDDANIGGMAETLLDIEMAGAMAPGAALNVYVAADRKLQTFVDMYNQFVTDDTSDVMTTSWGWPEADGSVAVTTDQIFMQAAAQGISMFAAAGDAGSGDGTGRDIVADYPSSSLYITAANGTQLSISDLEGTYGSEVVWNDADCFHQGPGSTGGAISHLFERPGWQRGPGLPQDVDMRMNSGIGLTASCSHPMVVYNEGWQVSAGTSAVAPMLAGLFAVAVSRNGDDRLGQSNSLIYADANVNYSSDFHDVTAGSNGAFEAGPDWDHPTGWGSVNAARLIAHVAVSGAKGTLEGTVTDAASGSPVAGARITVGNLQIVSAEDGTYSTVLPAGDATVTVSAFGYGKTSASVHISDGDTVTQNFALTAGPKAALSGKITDGSGHGYGLYADIKVSTAGFGPVAEVWTDPETGKYSVKLPKGFDYKVQVAAAFDGYKAASEDITLSGNKAKDFALTVTQTCSAPGYSFLGPGGFSQDFNGSVFPPDGWTTINAIAGSPLKWKLNTGYDQNNITGGTGTAADARGASFPEGYFGPFDNSLVTPPIHVDSLNGTILKYKANFGNPTDTTKLDLDISKDGGNTWTTVLHWQESHGKLYNLPGENVRVNLAPYVTAGDTFQLRWRHYNNSSSLYYAQIDDVVIGACAPLPGGLVVGEVIDGNTGSGIAGAHVDADNGVGGDTVANSADHNVGHPNPLYLFFLPKGKYVLTATDVNYSAATDQVRVADNQVIRTDFTLKAARFENHPDALTLHVPVGSSATASFALKNTGAGAGSFRLFPINSAPSTASSTVNQGGRVVRIPIEHPAWMTSSLSWIRSKVRAQGHPFAGRPETRQTIPYASDAWQAVAPYPIAIGDVTVARDGATGKLYAMGGFGDGGVVASAYVYDPEAGNWSPIADAPVARDAAVSAFVNGKYYVFNGWDSSDSDPVTEVDIYDPSTNTWSQGKPNPAPAGGGSAIAVLNGSIYIVGGCKKGACNIRLNAVKVYHPALDSWSTAADYPRSVTFAACGAIHGKLYCAGGSGSGQGTLTAGYVYNPVSNNWTSIAGIPVAGGHAGSFYTAANGLLLVAGGVSDTDLTNQTVAYDPGTASWTDLPPLNMPVTRGGSACGFYQVGGINSAFLLSSVTAGATMLPGYDQCGKSPSIPWLTVTPMKGTLKAGDSAVVTLTFDATSQKAFTTSEAYLSIANNSPYDSLTVPLTVHWDAQPANLVLTGSASPSTVLKGGNLVYTLGVENKQAKGHGAATETMLSYWLPSGVSYVNAGGDGVSCRVPSEDSSSAPEVATDGQPGVVACDFGTLAQGASKTLTIAVQANQAGKLRSHFEVSSREPDDSGRNTLDLTTTVIGEADLSTSAENATLTQGSAGTLQVTVANGGPDAATEVKLKLSAGAAVKLQSAQAGQGQCVLSGSDIECDLGEVAAGGQAAVKVSALGTGVGSAQVTAQATTTADDGDAGNNVATATVTVKAASSGGGNNNGGGGGALGWLALAALLGLAFSVAGTKYRRRRRA